MRIQQVKGHKILSDISRRRLENVVFAGNEDARRRLQEWFPHHIINEGPGTLKVTVKDGSFVIAEFKRV